MHFFGPITMVGGEYFNQIMQREEDWKETFKAAKSSGFLIKEFFFGKENHNSFFSFSFYKSFNLIRMYVIIFRAYA